MKQEQPDRRPWAPILELCEAQVADISLDDLYQQALTIIQREMEIGRVALMLSQGLEFVAVAARGLPAETVAELHVRVPDDVAELLATSIQAIPLSPDEAPWASSLWDPFQGPVMVQALSVAKRLVGLLVLSRDRMQPDELDLLVILGSQIAGAIDRERWFCDGLRHVTELNMVNEIGQLLSTALDQQQLLSLLHQQVGRVLDTSNFYVALYDEDRKQLRFPFCWDVGQPLQEPPRPLGTDKYASKTEYVIHTGEPFLSQWDTLGLLPIRELQNSPHTPRSFLGVPLLWEDRLLGVMAVQNYEREHAYDENDLNLLITVAAQAAIALENARLFQGRERRITELAILNEMSRALSSALELDNLLETVYQQVSRLFDTSDFYIATYEEESAEWTAVLDVEHGQQQPRTRYKVEAGVTGYIIRNRQPLRFHTAKESIAFEKAQGFETIGKRATSWMGVPLIAVDKVVGVMAIQSYEHEHLYGEQDLALFSTIAAQVAIAIESLRLLEETRRRAQELEVINEIGQTITSMLDPDAVFRQIVDTTKARFGYYFVNISMVRGERMILWDASTIGDSDIRPERGQVALDLHGSGLNPRAARTGQPVLVNDVRDDPNYVLVPELADTLAELAVPISVKGRVIGVLDLQSDQPNVFDQVDVTLFQSLADQAGVAMENARLFEETHRRAQELVVLNELARALITHLSVEQVLDEAYWGASRLIDTSNFYIGLYDPEKGEINFALDVTTSEQDEQIRSVPADQGIAGYIIRNRTSVLLEDDVRERQEELGIEMVGEESLSWLGVPLMIGDQVLGVMAAQSYTTPRAYDEHDRDLLQTLADQVTIALENLRLLEETRRRAQELEAVNEVGQIITSVLDLDALLHQIVDITKARFDLYYVSIMLIEGEDHLVYRVGSTIGDSDTRIESGQVTLDLHGPGLNPTAARTGQPVLVNDVLSDPRYLPLPELAATRSELDVPIEVKGRVVGVLGVQSDQPDAFDQADVALIQSLASQAGVAIENARLFQRQERRITELAILNEISRAVSSALQLDELLETVHQQVGRLFDATNFYIVLYYEDADEWAASFHLEHGQRQPVVRRKAETGLTGYIIRNRQPLLLRDTQEYNAFHEEQGIDFLGERSKSWLGVPLIAVDKVVGVMAIQSYEHEHLYSEQDLALFSTIAAQTAIAIDNARLFEEAQRLAGTVRELSTPVIQVWDQVLVLPLIGGIDEVRSHRIMETLLQGITQHHAQVVIIDVTGVPIIDSWVADHLLHTAQATELLGARCVLTGISPEIAQSIVSLGLPLTGLTTLPNLQAGIRYALALLRRVW